MVPGRIDLSQGLIRETKQGTEMDTAMLVLPWTYDDVMEGYWAEAAGLALWVHNREEGWYEDGSPAGWYWDLEAEEADEDRGGSVEDRQDSLQAAQLCAESAAFAIVVETYLAMGGAERANKLSPKKDSVG